jgi:4-oxalocrotonate tautomerase
MPIIRVEMSVGRSAEAKERFVAAVTRLAADVLICPVESVDVLFTEIDGNNWARGGTFYSQSRCADGTVASDPPLPE